MAILDKSYEVDNRTGINHEGPEANKPLERLTAASIIGDRVENLQGEEMGRINDLLVNMLRGQVEYAVIEYGNFLSTGKLYAVPFRELMINPEKRIFMLNRDKAYLENAPGFDKSQWTNTSAQEYFDNVKLYYGSYVPPFP
jgi:hypothetical protein